jgi:hypothetical protein
VSNDKTYIAGPPTGREAGDRVLDLVKRIISETTDWTCEYSRDLSERQRNGEMPFPTDMLIGEQLTVTIRTLQGNKMAHKAR